MRINRLRRNTAKWLSLLFSHLGDVACVEVTTFDGEIVDGNSQNHDHKSGNDGPFPLQDNSQVMPNINLRFFLYVFSEIFHRKFDTRHWALDTG